MGLQANVLLRREGRRGGNCRFSLHPVTKASRASRALRDATCPAGTWCPAAGDTGSSSTSEGRSPAPRGLSLPSQRASPPPDNPKSKGASSRRAAPADQPLAPRSWDARKARPEGGGWGLALPGVQDTRSEAGARGPQQPHPTGAWLGRSERTLQTRWRGCPNFLEEAVKAGASLETPQLPRH